ncbi:hypothetical protein, partial [Cytobacillus oceanisediminis]|uniref:hypothetical protein n=1 Tax=Cytobacillus oceanisediminis TaxID=665099 RepID=UPI001C92CB94
MDISKAEQRQNVQERGFNGHFEGGAAPRCPKRPFKPEHRLQYNKMTATFAECFLISVHHRLDDGHFCCSLPEFCPS